MPYVDANGIKLFYESAGEGSPIILQGHHHLSWMFFSFPFFSEHGYQIYSFDRRGTGRSDNPPGPWTIKDFADDLVGLMDALSIEKAIIGGASLGGIITSQVGLDYPNRVKAMIIANTCLYFSEFSNKWIQDWINRLKVGEQPTGRQPPSFEWQKEGPWSMDPEFSASKIGSFIVNLRQGGMDPDSTIKMLEAAKGWDQRPRTNDLKAVKVPTLVLVGGYESQNTQMYAYEWHKLIPNSEYIILPETHHAGSLENPSEWNTAILRFLRRHGL